MQRQPGFEAHGVQSARGLSEKVGSAARTPITALLLCGIASFVLYVAMDVLAALAYDGYSYKSQTISELSAVGAPTRTFFTVLGVIWAVVVLGFGIGVFKASGQNRKLKGLGCLLVLYGMVGLLWPIAPMHQREVLAAGGDTWTDTLHLVLGGVDVVLALLVIGIGAAAMGTRFRFYSIATILALLVFGVLTGLEAPRVSDNEATPWLGIVERVNVYGSMLWFAVLATVLLGGHGGIATDRRKTGQGPPRTASKTG